MLGTLCCGTVHVGCICNNGPGLEMKGERGCPRIPDEDLSTRTWKTRQYLDLNCYPEVHGTTAWAVYRLQPSLKAMKVESCERGDIGAWGFINRESYSVGSRSMQDI